MSEGAAPQRAYRLTRNVKGTETFLVYATSAPDAERRFKDGAGELTRRDLEPVKGHASVARHPKKDRIADPV